MISKLVKFERKMLTWAKNYYAYFSKSCLKSGWMCILM